MSIFLTLISALLISISQITSKLGLKNTNIYIATLIKSIIILLISFLFIKKLIFNIYIILSSICLTLSWIYYFKCVKKNKLTDIIPIFLLSTIIILILNSIIFNTKINILSFSLLCIGNILMISKIDKDALIQTVLISFQIILLKLSKVNEIDAIFINSLISTIILSFVVIIKKIKFERNNLFFIIISSLLTIVSWLLYYKAINIGDLNIIVPLEKVNIIITLILSCIILKEKINKKIILGLIIISLGTILSMV